MSMIGVKFVDGGKVFNIESDLELNVSDKIIVETIRGLEIGIVTTPSQDKGEEEIKSIKRIATPEDLKKAEELKKQEGKVVKITNDLISKYKLDMKLVNVSFTIDGTKVIINYVCEDRVDFRELVKDLASQLKLRIELRQIGIRDQAKIIGGIGFCGKECCCKKYLNDFDKVSIKMAKTQGLSLNPTKISGICGRLMCCLSYENEFYSEIASIMPKLNSRVKTKDGVGQVIYNNLLKSTVTVRIESDNDIKVNEYPVNEIEVLAKVQENKVATNQEKKQIKEEPKKESKPKNIDDSVVKENLEKDTQNKSKDHKNFKKKKKHKFNKNETKN